MYSEERGILGEEWPLDYSLNRSSSWIVNGEKEKQCCIVVRRKRPGGHIKSPPKAHRDIVCRPQFAKSPNFVWCPGNQAVPRCARPPRRSCIPRSLPTLGVQGVGRMLLIWEAKKQKNKRCKSLSDRITGSCTWASCRQSCHPEDGGLGRPWGTGG